MPAAIVVALARLRLGDDKGCERLDQVLADAMAIGELQYLAPARLALVEAMWLRGEPEHCRRHAQALAELPLDRLNPWNSGDVAVWFHRCGMPDLHRSGKHAVPPARQLEIDGRHCEAADALLEKGMRYDAAMALAHAGGADVAAAMAKALQLFEEIGARRGIDFVRRRAAAHGLEKHLPGPKRGPYAKSRSHPLGLTGREVQILKHVKEGMSNREISLELRRSERTIEHHMSAILGKLGVRNRIEALIRVQTEPWLVVGGDE
jgi:DNA-binding CsgD family transcriptional regulator